MRKIGLRGDTRPHASLKQQMNFVNLFTGDNPVLSEMYVGCWSDVNDAYTRDMERLLNPSQQYWEGFTLGRCITACHFLQYRYAAMQVCASIRYCGTIS